MADASAPSVLFLGMAGAFSLPPLEAVLNAGVHVRAVLLPPLLPRPPRRERVGVRVLKAPAQLPAHGLPILTPYPQRNIVHLAWERGIPVYEVTNLRAVEALDVVPDVIVVACFDRLIPSELRARAKLAVNIHPSLLPDNRGPAPLFWTFRLGQPITGVTIHRLEEKADAGAILAQQEVPVPDGIDGAQLDRRLAALGGELLVQVVRDFAAGQLQPKPQDETRATYHPWPSEADWAIPDGWPPRRASNFIRGTAHMRPSG